MNTQPDTPNAKRPARRAQTLTLDLDLEVRRLLDFHRGGGRWQVIADDTDVSYSWLSKFARGVITNPSYDTLRRLYLYLRNRRASQAASTPPPPPPPLPPAAMTSQQSETA